MRRVGGAIACRRAKTTQRFGVWPYDADMSREWDDFQRAKDEILDRQGISKAEWVVLDALRLQSPLRPKELAKVLVGYMESFPDSQFTAAQYSTAMTDLVEKGFLYILGFADAVSPAPPYSAWDDALIDGFEGGLDFTPSGYEVMKEISDAYEQRMGRPLLRAKEPPEID